jgi:hypothetical protein
LSTPSEAVERIRECLYYRFDGPYIVIENVCRESFLIEAIEVRYYVTVKVEESVMEPSMGKREISERLSIGKRIEPGGSIDIYFGPVENVVTVYVIAEYGGGKYKVELRMKRSEQGEEAGEQQG